MFSTTELFLLLFSLPAAISVSFPLTAVTEYSSLAQCAQSHVSVQLSMWSYAGCSLQPLSSYGSCICAERISSLQREISIAFEFDTECSSTSVQPFVTAFCSHYGVNLAEKEQGVARTTATTTAGGSQPGATGLPTPGSTGVAGQPKSTSTPSSSQPSGSSNGSSGGGGLSDNKITIIATVVGSVAGVIAMIIAFLTYRHMKRR